MKIGFNLKTYFIYGLPQETKDDMQETYNLIKFLTKESKKLKVEFRVSVFQFRPYHGTKFYFDLIARDSRFLDIRLIEDNFLSDKIKRTQFNFTAGNFSSTEQEVVSEYIQKSLALNQSKKRKMDINNNKKVDVMWVGLSHKQAKEGEIFAPLGINTNSGKVVWKIESRLSKLSFYKTNLVKFAPLDQRNKLRYPTSSEMENDFLSLTREIEVFKPKIIFLLGSKVSDFVLKMKRYKPVKSKDGWRCYVEAQIDGIYFVSIFHPSYVYVYKRKKLNEYINTVYQIVEDLL